MDIHLNSVYKLIPNSKLLHDYNHYIKFAYGTENFFKGEEKCFLFECVETNPITNMPEESLYLDIQGPKAIITYSISKYHVSNSLDYFYNAENDYEYNEIIEWKNEDYNYIGFNLYKNVGAKYLLLNRINDTFMDEYVHPLLVAPPAKIRNQSPVQFAKKYETFDNWNDYFDSLSFGDVLYDGNIYKLGICINRIGDDVMLLIEDNKTTVIDSDELRNVCQFGSRTIMFRKKSKEGIPALIEYKNLMGIA